MLTIPAAMLCATLLGTDCSAMPVAMGLLGQTTTPVTEKKLPTDPAAKQSAKTDAAGKKPADGKKDDKAAAKTAEKKDAAKQPEKKDYGPTHKVKKGPFKIDVTLRGAFETPQMEEISFSPEVWPELTIAKVAAHGKAVKKGETIIELDSRKIDESIKDIEQSSELTSLALKQAELELKNFEKTYPLDLAAMERNRKVVEEDFKRYVEFDKAFSEKGAHMAYKRAQSYLDNEMEELKQLEKMYKADDLTEESEEIILKRQKNSVENAKFYMEEASKEHENAFKYFLPRRDIAVREGYTRAGINYEHAKITMPMMYERKKLEFEKAKYDQAKSADRLGKLKKDRAAMDVKAPVDGVIYYGDSTNGQFTKSGLMIERLKAGQPIRPLEVVLTVVSGKPSVIRATVSEKDLDELKAGARGKAMPTSFSETKLPAKLESIASIPSSPGNFDAKIHVDLPKGNENIVTGMACTVKFTPFKKTDALMVPASAVIADELDDDKFFVYVSKKSGKPEKRAVTCGKRADGQVEIVKGVAEGDEIYLSKPKD